MLPISDDNPRENFPAVTLFLIIACALVFLWQAALDERSGVAALYAYGFIPARFFGEARLPAALEVLPAWLTPVSSMFLHGGLLHLGGNMLFLWVFGDNVEDSMGRARFFVFYIACGIAAALAQAAADTASTTPMVGASGAIAGVLGAYILLHPRATVRTLVFLGFFVTIIRVPAMIMLGLWFLLQFVSAASRPIGDSGVAFWAHVGGFLAGMVLVPVLRRRRIDLLQPPRSAAFEREPVRGPWGR